MCLYLRRCKVHHSLLQFSVKGKVSVNLESQKMLITQINQDFLPSFYSTTKEFAKPKVDIQNPKLAYLKKYGYIDRHFFVKIIQCYTRVRRNDKNRAKENKKQFSLSVILQKRAISFCKIFCLEERVTNSMKMYL